MLCVDTAPDDCIKSHGPLACLLLLLSPLAALSPPPSPATQPLLVFLRKAAKVILAAPTTLAAAAAAPAVAAGFPLQSFAPYWQVIINETLHASGWLRRVELPAGRDPDAGVHSRLHDWRARSQSSACRTTSEAGLPCASSQVCCCWVSCWPSRPGRRAASCSRKRRTGAEVGVRASARANRPPLFAFPCTSFR